MTVNSEPLVSVLIPAYNHENFIQETIFSVIEQTYKNIELIVIDDGSSDSTWNKIQEVKKQCDQRFIRTVLQTQKNVGTAITNRKLQEIAEGTYFYNLASDDVLERDAVEVQMEFLKKNPDYICVYGDNSFIDYDSVKIYIDEKKQKVNEKSFYSFYTYCEYASAARFLGYGKYVKGREDYRKLDYIKYSDIACFGNFLPIGALIKKEVLKDIEPLSINSPLEDSYLNCRLAQLGKIKILDRITYKYRIHSTSRGGDWNKLHILNLVTYYYELYLADTKYSANRKELECCKNEFINNCIKNWNLAKKSSYWDENFYRKRYPEIIDKGFIPLVHYLSYGIQAGGKKYIPSKYFDNFLRRPAPGENPFLPKSALKNTFIYLFIRWIFRISIKKLCVILKKIKDSKDKNKDKGDFV